jgi:hypothetical protein
MSCSVADGGPICEYTASLGLVRAKTSPACSGLVWWAILRFASSGSMPARWYRPRRSRGGAIGRYLLVRNLIRIAQGVDLLVHEVAVPEDLGAQILTMPLWLWVLLGALAIASWLVLHRRYTLMPSVYVAK